MRRRLNITGPAVLACMLVTGCAAPTEVVKLYEDPAVGKIAYQRLLVVDVSSDSNQQQQFENEITAKLSAKKVASVPGHSRLDASKGLLQDDVNRVAADVGADAILITHVASVDTTVDLEEGQERLKFECRGGDPVDYFLYDHEVIREPDSVKVAHTVVVISSLYDAKTHERIWTIQSTCFQKSSMSEVLIDEAEAIVRQLRMDHLI